MSNAKDAKYALRAPHPDDKYWKVGHTGAKKSSTSMALANGPGLIE